MPRNPLTALLPPLALGVLACGGVLETIDPAGARLREGEALGDDGDTDGAVAVYQEVQATWPDSRAAEKAQGLLEPLCETATNDAVKAWEPLSDIETSPVCTEAEAGAVAAGESVAAAAEHYERILLVANDHEAALKRKCRGGPWDCYTSSMTAAKKLAKGQDAPIYAFVEKETSAVAEDIVLLVNAMDQKVQAGEDQREAIKHSKAVRAVCMAAGDVIENRHYPQPDYLGALAAVGTKTMEAWPSLSDAPVEVQEAGHATFKALSWCGYGK